MATRRVTVQPAGMTSNLYRLIYDIIKNTPVFQVMRGNRLIYESDTIGDAKRVAVELEKRISNAR